MLEPLYQVTEVCGYCETEFRTSKVRSSFKKAAHTDTDFYCKFKTVNPDFYVVAVCPFCGYAFTENFSSGLSPEFRTRFELTVRKNWQGVDYGKERSWEEALKTYKLALLCAQIKQEKERVVAGLLHHIAWLHREKGDVEQEKRFLQLALEEYIKVYEREGIHVNNARLMYLLGELNRRLGRYNEAVRWFARVVNDKTIMDSAMIRASRDQWAAARENMQEEQASE
ncbi:DUF2225 domain-containing protein [Gorillibacterium sp. CAU 1737]|uniref:DUF2225 domain-containing protein n=1 Tax=Gorillibacterium sp. CAU 1737 TaxID=3140362 RepID=UPI003260B47C